MTIGINKDEARTILWALQIVHAQEAKRLSRKGVDPCEHRTTKNISAAFAAINAALVKS